VTGLPGERIAVLSGPNLAREIMEQQPAAATIACPDEDAARRFQTACHTPYFRPYTSTDVVGCEMGGAVKNVVALAVGIAAGMGLGDNAGAVLITRGLAETTRLAVRMGAHPATLAGLSGLGDLVATCSSPLSVRQVVRQLAHRRPSEADRGGLRWAQTGLILRLAQVGRADLRRRVTRRGVKSGSGHLIDYDG
jgi:glycerol-3-phosphate dehydrogenase